MGFRFLEKMSQKAWHFLLIFGKCGEFFQVFYLYNRVLTPLLHQISEQLELNQLNELYTNLVYKYKLWSKAFMLASGDKG